MYRLIRNILFLFPPESVHYFSMNFLKMICSVSFMRRLLSRYYFPRRAEPVHGFGLKFSHPVGLAAGFDKNARYLRELEALGFAFVEIGTVTPRAQEGNPRPRLFRLPGDRALINRMGFNNDGAERVAQRLKKWRSEYPGSRLVVGGNIGKNKDTPNENAWQDYEACFRSLHPWVDYFAVNVSSPNTPGLRALQEKDALKRILMHLHMINNGKAHAKPILLKIAPDLARDQMDDVIDLALEIQLDGIVAANTSINRADLVSPARHVEKAGAGGLSGAPLRARSTEMIKYIRERSGDRIPIIGSGGIFDGGSAREKFEAGALLAQVWTGFVYEGPAIVKKICNTLDFKP